MVHNFYYLSIHILILRKFIIQKQEQTLLFLEFKVRYLIYCNLLLKIIDFIIGGSTNPRKKDCFAGVRPSTTTNFFLKLVSEFFFFNLFNLLFFCYYQVS